MLMYLREEYRAYVDSCAQDGTQPLSFRAWVDVVYHYEREDDKDFFF